MQITAFTVGALFAVLPLVQASGSVNVYNKCDFNVYLWAVDADNVPSEPTTLEPNGSPFSQAYRSPTFGGVSLKLSNDTSDSGPITQIEYTLDGFIWYDLSNVNCKGDACPFQKYGMYLESGSGCPTVSCAAGVALCKGAYNNPDDNENSLSCDSTADTSVYLCADSASGSDSSSSTADSSDGIIGSSPSTAAPASSTPTSSASSVPTPDYNTPSAAASSSESSTSAAVVEAAQPSTVATTAAPAVATVFTTVTAAVTTTAYVHAHPRRHQHAHHPRDFHRI